MTNEEPFLVVTRKKNRRYRKQLLKKDQQHQTETDQTGHIELQLQSLNVTFDYDKNKIIKIVQKNIQELRNSAIYLKIQDIFTEIFENNEKVTDRELICLGLGSLSSYISRHQFALGHLLQEKLSAKSVKYSDPCFTTGDIKTLETFNIEVLKENCEGKYLCKSDYITIFYLPHCPKQLVNNLLWKNWTSQQLRNLVLITNSFETILERTPSRLLENSAEFIVKINPYCTEYQLPESNYSDIFNDLSIIHFNKLEKTDPSLWTNPSEPKYLAEDLELIVKNVS